MYVHKVTKQFPYDNGLKYANDALGFNSQNQFHTCSRKNFYTYNVELDTFDSQPILMTDADIRSGINANRNILYVNSVTYEVYDERGQLLELISRGLSHVISTAVINSDISNLKFYGIFNHLIIFIKSLCKSYELMHYDTIQNKFVGPSLIINPFIIDTDTRPDQDIEYDYANGEILYIGGVCANGGNIIDEQYDTTHVTIVTVYDMLFNKLRTFTVPRTYRTACTNGKLLVWLNCDDNHHTSKKYKSYIFSTQDGKQLPYDSVCIDRDGISLTDINDDGDIVACHETDDGYTFDYYKYVEK